MDDDSVLLGHSSIRTTERYYAPWDLSWRDRLLAIVRDVYARDPLGRSLGGHRSGLTLGTARARRGILASPVGCRSGTPRTRGGGVPIVLCTVFWDGRRGGRQAHQPWRGLIEGRRLRPARSPTTRRRSRASRKPKVLVLDRRRARARRIPDRSEPIPKKVFRRKPCTEVPVALVEPTVGCSYLADRVDGGVVVSGRDCGHGLPDLASVDRSPQLSTKNLEEPLGENLDSPSQPLFVCGRASRGRIHPPFVAGRSPLWAVTARPSSVGSFSRLCWAKWQPPIDGPQGVPQREDRNGRNSRTCGMSWTPRGRELCLIEPLSSS